MKPLREMLNFNLMMAFYLQGLSVARHDWEYPVNNLSGYIFTAEDQMADDWMVVEDDPLYKNGNDHLSIEEDVVTEEEETND